jgi:hypothetical protein
MTYFQTRESLVEALKAIGLGDQTGIVYPHIRQSQFSIARHFGGMKINSKQYDYLPAFDWLIRADAHKDAVKWAKAQAKEAKPQRKAEPLPLDLFGG